MPCGPRKRSSSSIRARIRRSLSSLTSDSRRRPSTPGTRRVGDVGEQVVVAVEVARGCCAASAGKRSSTSAVDHGRRAQRQQADERAHLDPLRRCRRAAAARRRRSRPRRPTSRRGGRRAGRSRRRSRRSARRTSARSPRTIGSCSARASASSSMFWLNSAIHAVPSACSRRPPVGSAALRSNTPMLSRPRKPPSKTFLPARVLAVDPPREVEQQPRERLPQERRGRRRRRLPARGCAGTAWRRRAPAG